MSETASPVQPPPLEYAPVAKHRHVLRRVLGAMVLLLVAVAAYYRQPIAHRARLLYWQHECLAYARPAGTVVSADDGFDHKLFTTVQADPEAVPTSAPGNGNRFAQIEPLCLRSFESLAPAMARSPQPPGLPVPVSFLHERTSPAGNRRLVRITGYMLAFPGGLDYAVIRPASLFHSPELLNRSWLSLGRSYVPVTLHHGQPDPKDSSHFTIDFVCTEKKSRGTLDGWLKDDDTVDFKIRDPAATQGVSAYWLR
jgi:hypothetical protein